MTVTEATISMVNHLTESELFKVQNYIEKLVSKRKIEHPQMKTYTREEFIDLIKQSDEDIKANRVITLEEDREYMRKKYGF